MAWNVLGMAAFGTCPYPAVWAQRMPAVHYIIMMRTNSVTEIPLRFYSFYLRFLS
eukprot:COSAG01_NODE_3301_length_6295_cov_20.275823_5_plen_55_part_00